MSSDRDKLRQRLAKEITSGPIPVHIGIIMDGNGRWAKANGYTRIRGHQFGAANVKRIVRCAKNAGVKHVSLYVFSSENWSRPSLEDSGHMRLIRNYLRKQRDELHAEGFRFHLVGRAEGLAPEILHEAKLSRELMAGNSGPSLNLCINYGGRAEIIDAVRAIVRDGLSPEAIDEAAIARRLYAPDVPDPDLIVRTSGEMRTSNFLLWQAAYAELYFTPVFWPDFDEVELYQAILSFQGRHRRFGKTDEQLQEAEA